MPDAMLRKLLSPVLYGTGYFQRQWRERARGGGFTIVLIYHRVVDPADAAGLFTVEHGLAPDVFEAQMRFMLRHFTPVLPRDIPAADPADGIRFAVTFDDGYEDNATVAAPILERLGLRAAFYVTTEFVGSDRRFWWERLGAMLRRARVERVDVAGIGLEDPSKGDVRETILPLATVADREHAHEVLSDRLRPLPPGQIPAELARLEERLGVHVGEEGRDYPLMGWDRIRELHRRGFEIGCHTETHANLRAAPPAEIETEVLRSTERIGSELGEMPRTFAYPYGYWGAHAAEVVRRAGFSHAFTTEKGVVETHGDRFAMPRIDFARRWPFALGYKIHDVLSATSASPSRSVATAS